MQPGHSAQHVGGARTDLPGQPVDAAGMCLEPEVVQHAGHRERVDDQGVLDGGVEPRRGRGNRELLAEHLLDQVSTVSSATGVVATSSPSRSTVTDSQRLSTSRSR